MAKKIDGYIKLQIPSRSSKPIPPSRSSTWTKRGKHIMEFCKSFNAATQKLEQGMPIPVVITVFQDKSFVFETKSPPVSYFIKKALNSKRPLKHLKRSYCIYFKKRYKKDHRRQNE